MLEIKSIIAKSASSLATGVVQDTVIESIKNKQGPTVDNLLERVSAIDAKKVAIGAVGVTGSLLLKPFMCELLGVGESDLGDAQEGEGLLSLNGGNVKRWIIEKGVKYAVESAASASIKHAPELLTAWGPKALAHMHGTLHEYVGEAIGHVGDCVSDMVSSGAEVLIGDAISESVVDEGTGEVVQSVVGRVIGKLLSWF